MTQIIQLDPKLFLEPDRLQRLFDESMPQAPHLPPGAARIALVMYRAGRDAPAIAERLDVPVHAASAFIRRVKAQEDRARAAAEERQRHAEALAAMQSKPAAAPVDSPRVVETPLAPPAVTPPEPMPDASLNLLQRGAMRLMRLRGTSIEDLARAFRTSTDHVRRICKEAP
jgi:hypothetical protein